MLALRVVDALVIVSPLRFVYFDIDPVLGGFLAVGCSIGPHHIIRQTICLHTALEGNARLIVEPSLFSNLSSSHALYLSIYIFLCLYLTVMSPPRSQEES